MICINGKNVATLQELKACFEMPEAKDPKSLLFSELVDCFLDGDVFVLLKELGENDLAQRVSQIETNCSGDELMSKIRKAVYTIGLFDYAGEFHEGMAKVKLNEHECGYVNQEGQIKIRIECGFYDAQDFSEGYAAVRKNGKWGYIDSTGKVVVDYQFVDAKPFKLGLAPVRVANTRKVSVYCSSELAHQWGYIDITGKIVIPPKYDDAGPFNLKWGVARVGIMRYTSLICGFINNAGQVVIPIEHDRLSYLSDDGLACLDVDQHGDKSFINHKGNRAFYTSFDMVGSFSEGYCAVRNNEFKWGYIDNTGKLVIDYKFDYADCFSDGVAEIKIEDKYGFINKQGVQIIEPKYQNVRHFSEGVAGVEINNKWGIIDLLGNLIVNPIYDCVFGCHDGLIPVKQRVADKDVWFYIHKDGTKLI